MRVRGQMRVRYESNPKHSQPWQRGRRGSLCTDPEARKNARTLLEQGEPSGGKRYAVFKGRAYCAQEHGDDAWHGHPVGWKEVPAELRHKWQKAKRVERREIRLHWEGHG